MTKDECKTCGREGGGHWIGCAQAAKPQVAGTDLYNAGSSSDVERERTRESECIVDGCEEPRRSDDKRVKYCETHSDPKNRK